MKVRVWLCMGGCMAVPRAHCCCVAPHCLLYNNYDLGTYHNSMVERQSGLTYEKLPEIPRNNIVHPIKQMLGKSSFQNIIV